MLERSNVEWPMWRKKVDRSLLHYGITPIPGWVCKMWDIESDFRDVNSKIDPRAQVVINLKKGGVPHEGQVYRIKTPALPFRLEVDVATRMWLRRKFLMSYLRAIETHITGGRKVERAVESSPAFWEFVDIEYNRKMKTFLLVSYYRQPIIYPAIMARLTDPTLIDRISPVNTENENPIE